MKIAIPSDSDRIFEHFGRAPEFTIFETEGKDIKSKEIIHNPGHETGSLPRYFYEQGIDTIITGGTGPMAIELLRQYDIRLISGVSGRVDEAIEKFINNTLIEGPTTCAPHSGRGIGIKKEDGHE